MAGEESKSHPEHALHVPSPSLEITISDMDQTVFKASAYLGLLGTIFESQPLIVDPEIRGWLRRRPSLVEQRVGSLRYLNSLLSEFNHIVERGTDPAGFNSWCTSLKLLVNNVLASLESYAWATPQAASPTATGAAATGAAAAAAAAASVATGKGSTGGSGGSGAGSRRPSSHRRSRSMAARFSAVPGSSSSAADHAAATAGSSSPPSLSLAETFKLASIGRNMMKYSQILQVLMDVVAFRELTLDNVDLVKRIRLLDMLIGRCTNERAWLTWRLRDEERELLSRVRRTAEAKRDALRFVAAVEKEAAAEAAELTADGRSGTGGDGDASGTGGTGAAGAAGAAGGADSPPSSTKRPLQDHYPLEMLTPNHAPALSLLNQHKFWKKHYASKMSFSRYLAINPYLRQEDIEALAARNPAEFQRLVSEKVSDPLFSKRGVEYLHRPEQRAPYKVEVRRVRKTAAAAAAGTRAAGTRAAGAAAGGVAVAAAGGRDGEEGGNAGGHDDDRHDDVALLWQVAQDRPLDTADMTTAAHGRGWAMVVLRVEDGLFVADHVLNKFHHSSIFAGKPVDFAGELRATGGRIEVLVNKSGHYKPGQEEVLKMLVYLRDRGVSIDTFDVVFIDGTGTRGKPENAYALWGREVSTKAKDLFRAASTTRLTPTTATTTMTMTTKKKKKTSAKTPSTNTAAAAAATDNSPASAATSKYLPSGHAEKAERFYRSFEDGIDRLNRVVNDHSSDRNSKGEEKKSGALSVKTANRPKTNIVWIGPKSYRFGGTPAKYAKAQAPALVDCERQEKFCKDRGIGYVDHFHLTDSCVWENCTFSDHHHSRFVNREKALMALEQVCLDPSQHLSFLRSP
eukprot:g4389.t1